MERNTLRRISLVLALVLSIALVLPINSVPAKAAAAPELSAGEGLALHCWNWSYKSIEENMAMIARMGYTSVQTSPIQQAKQGTAGARFHDWWVYYQPAAFSIDNSGKSALGTKAEFESMCRTAHSYGVKVIVDIVANHMGNQSSNDLSSAIISDLRNDPSCWHDITKNTYDYSKRYDITQWCMAGLPDLNTANKKVQNYVLSFMKECIDAGADGFRFDGAKHIETPDDGSSNCASDFWPTVIEGAKSYASATRGIALYCYGELLDSPGGDLPVSAYTRYISVTDNTWSDSVRNQVVGARNAGAYSYAYHKGNVASQLVLWAESHDTYANGTSTGLSAFEINKTWALIASRADAMGLYFARPDSMSQMLGTAAVTGWADEAVGGINRFHNYFVGQSEYVANEGDIAYVERGNAGVVLVNCKGSGIGVNVAAHNIKDGTYIDQISGNVFTVSGGRIKGSIGGTGIAVVYNGNSCSHSVHNVDGYCVACYKNVGHSFDAGGVCVCGAANGRTLYFRNSGNWSSVNFYSWYTGGGEITKAWPGEPMIHVEGNIYRCTLPGDGQNIIFNNGNAQTSDLTVPSVSTGKNLYDFIAGQWQVYTPASQEDTVPEETVPTQTEPEQTEPDATDATQSTATEPSETDPTTATEPEKAPSRPTDPTATEPVSQPEPSVDESGWLTAILLLVAASIIVAVILVLRRKKR